MWELARVWELRFTMPSPTRSGRCAQSLGTFLGLCAGACSPSPAAFYVLVDGGGPSGRVLAPVYIKRQSLFAGRERGCGGVLAWIQDGCLSVP